MERLARLAVIGVLLLPATGTLVYAQGLATIAGVVRDTSGAVLPGVTVEASIATAFVCPYDGETDPDRTADEIAVVLQGLLGHSSLVKDSDISGIALCSTVPSVLKESRRMISSAHLTLRKAASILSASLNAMR